MTETVLQYLAGAADGDGCVHASSPNIFKFVFSQATPGKAIVDLFCQTFVGGVTSRFRRSDECDEQFQVVFNGMNGVHVCKMLAPYSHLKRSQFEAGATWPIRSSRKIKVVDASGSTLIYNSAVECSIAFGIPDYTIAAYLRTGKQFPKGLQCCYYLDPPINTDALKQDRKSVIDILKHEKQQPHKEIRESLDVNYAAGMFDAEGNMSAVRSKSIRLKLNQKYAAICVAMRCTFGGSMTSRELNGTRYYYWDMTAGAASVLQKLYPHLVSSKREQARMLLDMTPGSASQTNVAISALKGLQRGRGPRKCPLSRTTALHASMPEPPSA